MIIQIYAITNKSDALALCKMGVDHIGIVASEKGDAERGIVSREEAMRLTSIIKDYGKIASLIVDTVEFNDVMLWIKSVRPNIFHLCRELSIKKLSMLKKMLNDEGVSIMYAVPVRNASSIKYAESIQEYVDFIMLDSPFESKQMPGFVGASGKTHDWTISAKIVQTVYKPVILGGGLSPENVQDAIKVVHPFGVDAKTALDIPNGHGRKDLSRVREFVEKVRSIENA